MNMYICISFCNLGIIEVQEFLAFTVTFKMDTFLAKNISLLPDGITCLFDHEERKV